MTDDLSTWLRDELAEMASTSSVDMELWDRFSNHVLEAADALEKLRARIEDIAELYNSAQLTPVPEKMLKDAIDEIVQLHARIAKLESKQDVYEYEQTNLWASIEGQAAYTAELEAALGQILNYTGGANNALEDEYVMERARAALGEKE